MQSSFTGEWHNGDTKEIVAIKVLKDTATRETEEDFMREVDIMSTFGHTNILSLKGMVLRDATKNPWMVFEYMPYGDLAEVLRANTLQFKSLKPGLQPLTKVRSYYKEKNQSFVNTSNMTYTEILYCGILMFLRLYAVDAILSITQ